MQFIIERTKNKEFHFKIVASNGRTLANSETYKQKGACVNAINAIRINCRSGNDRMVDQTKSAKK